MRPNAVLDTSVVVSAIGWRGDSRKVLMLLAHRRFLSLRSPYLTREWSETLAEVSARPAFNPNWANWLAWLTRVSRLVEDPPSKMIVRRDPKDNPVLALAISEKASFLVAHDRDLLDLEVPYGVRCVTPRDFLHFLLTA